MLDDVKTAIERLTVDLKSERPQRGPATDVRQAIASASIVGWVL